MQGDIHRSLKLNLIHQYSNGDLKTLHEFSTTPFEMESNPNLRLSNKKCTLTLKTKTITKPSFLAYLNSGMELNFHVAIDFTASNGDPLTPQSLHYMSENRMNSYEFAINCVGEVLQQYDTDKAFPAYGFGARLPPNGQVSHDFALSFDPSRPEVIGVNGIINAYKQSLASVRLYGPTNFSPIIRKVTHHVKQMEMDNPYLYSVLMILTDGIITDMNQTIDAIVDAADHAMSIIIIGVGEANFDNMEILDGDDARLQSRNSGKVAQRDIVQFVQLNQYHSLQSLVTHNPQFNRAVLTEIPGQVVDYMSRKGLMPKNFTGIYPQY